MKKFIEYIKELRKTARGKAVLFFGFYLFFFLILIVFVRSSKSNLSYNREYEKGKNFSVSFNELKNHNYSFIYYISLDGNEYIYEGRKNDKQELFHFQNTDYYMKNGEYFVKDNEWKRCDNPYYFSKFLDEENIYKMISTSTYISKTTYESGKTTFNSLLSSNTINWLLDGANSDFFEEPNKVSVDINVDGVLEEIHFYLDSYCVVNNLCEKSLDIKLSYSDFGKIESIEDIVY